MSEPENPAPEDLSYLKAIDLSNISTDGELYDISQFRKLLMQNIIIPMVLMGPDGKPFFPVVTGSDGKPALAVQAVLQNNPDSDSWGQLTEFNIEVDYDTHSSGAGNTAYGWTPDNTKEQRVFHVSFDCTKTPTDAEIVLQGKETAGGTTYDLNGLATGLGGVQNGNWPADTRWYPGGIEIPVTEQDTWINVLLTGNQASGDKLRVKVWYVERSP